MKAINVIRLMFKYNDCPACGNSKLGDGQGKLIVGDDTFTRECNCGFKITVNEEDKTCI